MTIEQTMKEQLKLLRELTGAGFMDCKNALLGSNSNFNLALKNLKENKLVSARKILKRNIKEGALFSYIHSGNKIGVLIELGCETDFVARNNSFKLLGHNIAVLIATMNNKKIEKISCYKKNMRFKQIINLRSVLDECFIKFENEIISGQSVRSVILNHIALFNENIQILRYVKFFSK